jgi:phage-related protein
MAPKPQQRGPEENGRGDAHGSIRWPLGMPLCRPMGGGLHELRVSLKGRQEARLFFCVHDETIVGLHAFFKTTRTTPDSELDLAKQRMRAIQ